MNLMMDFETLATTPDSVVLTLGACLFGKEQILGSEQWYFDVPVQMANGRRVEWSTLQWWMQQNQVAQKDAFFDGERLKVFDFFDKFIAFVLGGAQEIEAWSNGVDFDIAIIRNLHDQAVKRGYTKPLPWKFYNQRCYRTFKWVTGCDKLVTRTGTHHRGIDDALHQAKCLIAHWEKED